MKYYISFDTKEMPGKIIAVTVEIAHELVRDKDKKMNIALCDSPLYPQLVRYVMANPSRKADDRKG